MVPSVQEGLAIHPALALQSLLSSLAERREKFKGTYQEEHYLTVTHVQGDTKVAGNDCFIFKLFIISTYGYVIENYGMLLAGKLSYLQHCNILVILSLPQR